VLEELQTNSIRQEKRMTFAAEKTFTVEGIRVPDTSLAREITQFVRDTESATLFHHSSRVYYWSALAGKRRGLKFDRELLYVAAMFHDMGLTPAHSSAHERFEVDGANAARGFLRRHGIDQVDIDTVWTAIALHTTPGIPQHMHPVVAPVTAGVEMDVLGFSYAEYPDAEGEAVVRAHPRTAHFKEVSSRPSTTASSTSPRRPLATSRPMCLRTRTRTSLAAISAASSEDPLGAGKPRCRCEQKPSIEAAPAARRNRQARCRHT
jgi:HD domain